MFSSSAPHLVSGPKLPPVFHPAPEPATFASFPPPAFLVLSFQTQVRLEGKLFGKLVVVDASSGCVVLSVFHHDRE